MPAGYVVTRDGGIICTTTSTTCDDTNLIPGQTYSYLVTSTAGSQWVSATPLAMTATTASGSFALSAVSPSTVTAGAGLTFTVSATYGTGATDAAYTGVHTLDVTSSIPASPGGKASGGKVSAAFVAGVATNVTTALYGSGTQTLTVSEGSRTASFAIAVSPTSASALEVISATGSSVLCAPNGHVSIAAGKQLTGRVAVVDPYGNLASFATTLTINLSYSGAGTLTPASVTLPSRTSESTQSLTLTMPAGATKSGTLSFSALGTTLSRCSVN